MRKELGEDFVCFGDRTPLPGLFSGIWHWTKHWLWPSPVQEVFFIQFTEIPGISKVFHGGAVCYHNDAKVQVLDVFESMLDQHGCQ